MMKRLIITMALAVAAAQGWAAEPVQFADPTVVAADGRYWLSGTNADDGFRMLVSDDLEHWQTAPGTENGYILKKDRAYGTKWFWAPQIFRADGRWHLAYCANEQVALASSEKLTGLFTQDEPRAVDPSGPNIDPFFFKDSDGKWYLYYVRFTGGNRIWAAEFDWAAKKVKPETLRKCFDPTEPWENTPTYSAPYGIIEGPTVIKRGGKYYLFYSCNHFKSADYAVGWAESESPLGPWRKFSGNPIISRQTLGDPGSGHGDIFTGHDGKVYYVYHTHLKPNGAARQTKIVELLPEEGFRVNPKRKPIVCVYGKKSPANFADDAD